MEIKSFDDILKIQKEFEDKFARQIETLKEERPMQPAALLEQKMHELERSKARLEAVSSEREETLHRLDLRIARHKGETEQLEMEIKELRACLDASATK